MEKHAGEAPAATRADSAPSQKQQARVPADAACGPDSPWQRVVYV